MTTADANSVPGVTTQSGLRIDPEALDAVAGLALAASPRETGGILVGWHEDTTVIVTGMLVVPDKKAGRRHYVRNHKRAQKALAAHRQNCTDDRVGYVGEWHSHPAPQPPSSVDYNALAELTRGTNHQVALVVLAVHPNNHVTPIGATAHRAGREITITDLTIESRSND